MALPKKIQKIIAKAKPKKVKPKKVAGKLRKKIEKKKAAAKKRGPGTDARRARNYAELTGMHKKNPKGIRTTEDGTVIASGARATSIYRILALKSALKLETLGMKMSRGVNAAQLVRDEFGWKTRDKKQLLAQLEEWIATHMRPEDESQHSRLMPDLPVKTREDNPNRNTATGVKSTRWEDLWAVAHNVATPAQIINAWKADGRGALRGAVGDAIMERIERDERSMYGRRSWRETKREAINYLIEGNGIELLGLHKRSGELAYYVNSGDTYSTTIIFIGGRLTVGAWGDMIESGTVREVGNDELLGYRD